MFQRFNLFPHLTALDNVAIGLNKVSGLAKRVARERAAEHLRKVFLDDHQAMNERDFHSFERLHSVSIWRYAWEEWTMVTELRGVELH